MSENHQNSPENQPASLDQPQDAAIDRARRRLSGLGMSAILTLASRPVLATNCVSPSAAASGNMSHHGTPPLCNGKTVSYWAGTAPGQYPGGNPKFKDVFQNGTKSTRGDNDRLKTVLDETSNSNTGNKPEPISQEFAATLLNIRGGFIPASVLTEVQLIGMWNDWVADGIFNPQAGVNWDANQIVNYLRGLQA